MTNTARSSVERVADFGVGTVEILLFGGAAYLSSLVVSSVGKTTEEYVEKILKTTTPFPTATQGLSIDIALGHFINANSVKNTIHICSDSGRNATFAVGGIESIYQTWRYYKADHNRSWGTDIFEGAFRGALIGTGAGLYNEGKTLEQKIASVSFGMFFGCTLGGGIAAIGHLARSIHVPKGQEYGYDSPSPRR